MLFRAEGIEKSFSDFYAVRETDFTLETGRVTELTGRSGSGKSTLLNMMAGILSPTRGKVLFDDTDLYSLDEAALSAFRNRHIGVIPQGQSGLKNLTVLENVLMPCYIYQENGRKSGADGNPDSERDFEAYAMRLLELAGIADLRDAWASELSGGEGRRMAIARALIMKPELILADEPTGDLDAENTAEVLKLLRLCAEEQGSTVLLATHEPLAEQYADHLWRMDAGILKKER